IFDLGGVIVEIDYQITIGMFKKLGISDFDSLYGQYKQAHLFDGFDKGHVSPEQFREGLSQFLHKSIDKSDFDAAWNSMIKQLPAQNIVLLDILKNKYNTFLLSNTNEIHLEYFFRMIYDVHKVNQFESLFNKAYYSCRIGMRKPDREIYEFVLKDSGLKAEESLFIDDTSINLIPAEEVGIKTFLMPKGRLLYQVINACSL
ncbi:MAG TPA: HAD family phosphatase, partial [Bacteroidales bacterium]|nr:HAD family phosphatase [Bacteroidales bacterium]